MERCCKKCGKVQLPEAERALCDDCRAKRAGMIKRSAIAVGVGVLAVLAAAAGFAQAANKRMQEGELSDDQYDLDEDYDYEDDEDDDDAYDSNLANIGRAIDMMNGDEPYDANFVERWL